MSLLSAQSVSLRLALHTEVQSSRRVQTDFGLNCALLHLSTYVKIFYNVRAFWFSVFVNIDDNKVAF